MVRLVQRLLVVLFILPRVVAAQGNVLVGTVRTPTLAPVPGALVSVASLGIQGLTNQVGAFRLPLPPEVAGRRDTVRARAIGFNPQAVPLTLTAGTNRLDLTLIEQAVALDEIVVTGTAGSQERRAQGADVTVVDAARLVPLLPIATVPDVLQGRVAGLNLTPSSGSSGEGQRILIRGASTVSLSNEPLVFVDGVRADSRNESNSNGGQVLSRLFDLLPDDIDRIEVLKGPAAATLYGADATTGVIQVFTKRGRGLGWFSQALTGDYENIAPNWTPPANFARCGSAEIAADSPNALCRGEALNTVVHDSPLLREAVLRDGSLAAVRWSAQGGASQFGYYLSAGLDKETGTLPQNQFDRRSARVAFNFAPRSNLSLDVGLGLMRTASHIPNNNDNILGFGTALLGSPLTLGGPNNGWFETDRGGEAIGAIEEPHTVVRFTPTLQVRFSPAPWFTHRLTVGADLSRSETRFFYPKNSSNWYGAFLDVGWVSEDREHFDTYTIDYLANVHTQLGRANIWTADFSAGVQVVDTRDDFIFAQGRNLVTNAARSVSAAAERTAGQSFSQVRSAGVLGQWQVGYRNRAFVQAGARIDRNSAFGKDASAFFLPRFGASYVISEERWWQRRFPFIETLRLRAAFGTTGRSPQATAALESYQVAPYIASPGQLGQGVIPGSPGNPDIRPERGAELEAGVDLGAFHDRLGLGLTFSWKRTTDLLLQAPIPPSTGFPVDPFVNIGEVRNRSVELSLRAQLINSRSAAWDAELNLATLSNELVSLGRAKAFAIDEFRFAEGRPLGALFSQRIQRVEVANGRAIISDTAEYVGNPLPRFSGSLSTSGSLGQRLRISALWEWKTGYRVMNRSALARDRVFQVSQRAVLADQLPPEERLRRFGPYVTANGAPGPSSPFDVPEPYMEPGDFLRWRELAVAVRWPARWAATIGARGASLTLGVRNLALWTRYGGDPEVVTYASFAGAGQFLNGDFLTMPQPRRWLVRVSLEY